MVDLKIKATIRPKSGKFSVTEHDGRYIICLKSAPEKNKANIELIKELSRLTKRKVTITQGLKSKIKVLNIPDYTEEEFLKITNR